MSKNQDWFNEQYSGKEKINIAESNRLKLKGFLKIENFTKLKSITLKNFELTKLKISGCSQLTEIDLSELSKLTDLSLTKCPNITTLDYSTGLTNLEISGQLKEIDLSKLTKLTSLSVTDCQKLTGLDCSSTKLTSLKIINCPQLNKIIDKSKTKTKSLYVRGYSNLSTLDCLETGFTNLEINGCSKLNEVDLSKLPKITSLSVIDCSNFINLDCSSTGLTSLKISGCYRLEKFDCSKLSNLTSLSVIDCPKLAKFDCSSTENLTELEVSDLIELNCSNTSIKELSLCLCPYITKLDCSNNKNLKNLDISNCFKLGSINCSNSKLTSLDISYCPELEGKNIPGVVITRKKENIKNIVIVGRTGVGKSALANVLTGSDDFKESEYAVSETMRFKKKDFKWNENHFCVVDTIGAKNTRLGLNSILYEIAYGINLMPEGISQILYVVDGRFTEEEISTFNMIEGSILQDKINILGYVTLVKTKVDNFRSTEECYKDKGKMLKENENIAKIVRKCNDIVHVDNPPINIEENDDDDNDYISKINRNVRQKSRQKLLEYLEGVDPVKKNQYFRLKTWDKLHESIHEYVKNNEDAQKSDPELEAVFNASKELCLIL
ncbi:L domain-like protein [Rhizophagus irregularis]|uniref:L domain-like protein n=1 Tax=Rhizophagus irregularis TaxID=588596 RepID=A0A2N0RYP0_9GLOM|nr:L domain-like protein [Rhizophagus irregularis]